MPHGTHLTEAFYYKLTFFDPSKTSSATSLDMPLLMSRKTKAMFERTHYYPDNFFFFCIGGVKFFGRKTLSSDYVDRKTRYKKCSLLKPHMIVGMVSNERVTEKGVTVFYKPLDNSEKLFLFFKIRDLRSIDISFPYPVLSSGKEFVQSNSVWDATDELADVLNVGEEHFRRAAVSLLSKSDMRGKKVYDPACSTGKFLTQIKQDFPNAVTIGQDANPDMIAYAKRHSNVDELHLGDSSHPGVFDQSVDFIFFRFLNASVVSSEDAIRLFCRLSNCCKDGGKLILFGFTPVLISKEIFEMLGLEVDQTTGYDSESSSLFQFYVLSKKGPVPMLRYEDFSTYNFQKTQEFRSTVDDVIVGAPKLQSKL